MIWRCSDVTSSNTLQCIGMLKALRPAYIVTSTMVGLLMRPTPAFCEFIGFFVAATLSIIILVLLRLQNISLQLSSRKLWLSGGVLPQSVLHLLVRPQKMNKNRRVRSLFMRKKTKMARWRTYSEGFFWCLWSNYA